MSTVSTMREDILPRKTSLRDFVEWSRHDHPTIDLHDSAKSESLLTVDAALAQHSVDVTDS
jgi:hypothetical protein